jgi:hypothetical protein
MRNRAVRATIALLLFAVLGGQNMADNIEPKPAPAADRVGLPADYRTTFKHLRTAPLGQSQKLIIYANDAAASLTDLANLPYPYGSIIVAEWHRVDGDGGESTPFQVDVMRREKGYGEAYGDMRTGEWEYARYGPDGNFMVPSSQGGKCASCHQKAGKDRDWVYHGRF